MNKVKEKFSSEGRMLLAHDCMSKPANQPSQVLNLKSDGTVSCRGLYLLWQESRWLLKIIHLTSRWLNSGEMNPTPPWHFPAERADLPQNISKELHFGGFLTEAPLSHKISEGFFCLFFLSMYLLQLSWKAETVLNPSPIAVPWEVFQVAHKTRPCSCRDRHPANKSS